MRISYPTSKVAEKHGISVKEVNEIYTDIFRFMREKIVNLPLKDIDKESFQQLKTSFNIPGLGKIGVKFDKMKYIENKNYARSQNKND